MVDNLTAPRFVRATCVDCEGKRNFDISDGDTENHTAVYRCYQCDHPIRLDLNPDIE